MSVLNYGVIPSKDEREYLQEIGYELSDSQKATIVYHSVKDVEKRRSVLEEIGNSSKDEELKDQIGALLVKDFIEWEKFKDNRKRQNVFIITYYDEEYKCDNQAGIFIDFAQALSFAKERLKKFTIRKYEVVDQELPRRTHISHFNPNYFKEEYIVEEAEYDGGEIGAVSYADGTMQYLWSSELTVKDMQIADEMDRHRFENAYLPLPMPFEKGDIVRMADDPKGACGIVETSCEEWKKMMQREDEEGFYGDFFDSGLTVCFLHENREFCHQHINPVFLEKADVDAISDDDRTLLTYASNLVAGCGSLDFFLHAYDEYHGRRERACYGDVCHR